MITVTLSKKDLLNLVKGTGPQLSQIKDFQNRGLGSFTGGHVDKWSWNNSHLKTLDEQQLWDIYEECTREQRRKAFAECVQSDKFPLTNEIKKEEYRDIGDDVIPMYQELWKNTWETILNRMTDPQRKDLQFPAPGALSEEDYKVMEETGKKYRQYVSEKQFGNVKKLGPYIERTIHGVDILIDHSHDSLQKFIIIKTPTWGEVDEILNKNITH